MVYRNIFTRLRIQLNDVILLFDCKKLVDNTRRTHDECILSNTYVYLKYLLVYCIGSFIRGLRLWKCKILGLLDCNLIYSKVSVKPSQN